MEWFTKGLSIFGAFSAGAPSLYSLLRRKKSRTPAQYLAETRRVEAMFSPAGDCTSSYVAPSELKEQLNGSLSKLRQELIEDICEGRIKGDQVIANILSLLRDAQRNLLRLETAEPRGYLQQNDRLGRAA